MLRRAASSTFGLLLRGRRSRSPESVANPQWTTSHPINGGQPGGCGTPTPSSHPSPSTIDAPSILARSRGRVAGHRGGNGAQSRWTFADAQTAVQLAPTIPGRPFRLVSSSSGDVAHITPCNEPARRPKGRRASRNRVDRQSSDGQQWMAIAEDSTDLNELSRIPRALSLEF